MPELIAGGVSPFGMGALRRRFLFHQREVLTMPRTKDNTAEIRLVDAAKALQVGYLLARDLMLRGELNGIRRGRNWFVTRESLENAIKARRAAAQALPA